MPCGTPPLSIAIRSEMPPGITPAIGIAQGGRATWAEGDKHHPR